MPGSGIRHHAETALTLWTTYPSRRPPLASTMSNDMTRCLSAALEYAAQGIAIMPCAARGKKPALPRTGKEHAIATTDADQIRQWWTTRPRLQHWDRVHRQPATKGASPSSIIDGYRAPKPAASGYAR